MPGVPLAMSRLSPNLDQFPVFSSSAWNGKELSMTLRGAEQNCKYGTFDQVALLTPLRAARRLRRGQGRWEAEV